MTDIRRLHVLLCGYEIIPKTVSTRDRGHGFFLAEPICAYLIQTGSGWVLFDTGLDPAGVRDPALCADLFDRHGWTRPVVRAEHELDRQLRAIGVQPAEIGDIVLSHLHFDHTGYVKLCPTARVHLQRREYEAFRDGAANPAVFARDLAQVRNWVLADGDWELVPGLQFIDTRGHTAGHQSALVSLPSGTTLILTADAGDLRENFDHEVLPGSTVDDRAALASLRRLNALAQRPFHRLLLGHDPNAIQTYRLGTEFYR